MKRWQIFLFSILAIAIIGGAAGARAFQKLRIPQVVGYIAIGILVGESCLNIVPAFMSVGEFGRNSRLAIIR